MPADTLSDTAVQDPYLYVLTHSALEIVDIHNPATPFYVSSVAVGAPDTVDVLAMDGQFAYIGSQVMLPPYGCSVWPPDVPTALGPLTADPMMMSDILVESGHLYEICLYSGIRIYRIY